MACPDGDHRAANNACTDTKDVNARMSRVVHTHWHEERTAHRHSYTTEAAHLKTARIEAIYAHDNISC